MREQGHPHRDALYEDLTSRHQHPTSSLCLSLTARSPPVGIAQAELPVARARPRSVSDHRQCRAADLRRTRHTEFAMTLPLPARRDLAQATATARPPAVARHAAGVQWIFRRASKPGTG